MSYIRTVGVAAAAFVCMAAQSASASVLSIGGGVASVSCTPSCAGIIGGSITSSPSLGVTGGTAGALSGSAASLYDFNPTDPANEAKALNVLAGTSFTTGVQTDMGGVSSVTFSTLAQWIGLKIGNSHFFLQNTSGPITLLITYLKAEGRYGAGAGLSHITEFGSNEVPIPGAVWLMSAGVAGLGFSSRKKKPA
jgi:hypothetical protein